MTTEMGIRTGLDKDSIILASDLSRTSSSWEARGDTAFRQQTKSEGRKIYVDDKERFAICMSGVFDQHYVDFLSALLKGKINVKKATEKGYFPELMDLNNRRWDGRFPDGDYINGLLIATRFNDKPKLFTGWPLGRVEERAWTAIGSGSEYAIKHIGKQDKLIPGYLSQEEGIKLAIASLDEASQDIYTGGLDLVVVDKAGIVPFSGLIKNNFNDARDKSESDILKILKKSN